MVNPARLTTLVGLERLFPDPGESGRSLFPVATVRDWASQDVEGFATECVVRAGGKLLIDLDAFARWLEARRGVESSRKRSAATAAEAREKVRPIRPSFDEAVRRAGLGELTRARPRGPRRVPSKGASSA